MEQKKLKLKFEKSSTPRVVIFFLLNSIHFLLQFSFLENSLNANKEKPCSSESLELKRTSTTKEKI